MTARNQIDQAVRIRSVVEHNFPLDLIVRTPHNLKWRLEEGDWFLREIVARGKVLYDKPDAAMGAKGRSRLSGRTKTQQPEWFAKAVGVPIEELVGEKGGQTK